MRSYGQALVQSDWNPDEKRRLGYTGGAPRGKTMRKRSKRTAVCGPRGGASGETNWATAWVLDFQLPEL